jgi:quercetin dioxygenase-like cupin family protein
MEWRGGNGGDVRDAARIALLGLGEGTPIWFLNSLTFVKATADITGGAYGLLESHIPPGFSPPMHVHHREDEAFWVLDGVFTFCCGRDRARAQPGCFIFLPRGIPHSFVVEGDTSGRLLTLLSPGGGERFFVEAGRPAARASLPPAAPIDRDHLARVAHRFGIELVGPPLTPSAPLSAVAHNELPPTPVAVAPM